MEAILNEDSLIQILLWLPVISLLRLKSVCKSWRATIQNPFFIHSHATTTTVTTCPSPLLLRGKLFFTVSADNEEEVYLDTPGPEFEASEDLDPSDVRLRTMIGCCNGIICFHGMRTIMDHYPKYYQLSIISLWNPAIKQFRFLQIPFALQANLQDPFLHLAGFGFDLKTNDYKLLLITHKGCDDDDGSIYLYARHVHVYSLSTDSWRSCSSNSIDDATTDAAAAAAAAQPNLSKHRHYWNQGHYLNGSYIFLAGYLYDEFQEEEATTTTTTTTTSNSRLEKCFKHLIISFDFTQEIFRTIQLPFDLEPRNTNSADPILFGEKIAVLHSNFRCGRDYIDIWVLNGKNESSWSKFYSFVSYAPPYAQPKFIMDNGQFILLDTRISGTDDKKLQLLNVVTGEIKDLRCDWRPSSDRDCVTRVGVYKPSLIPIVGRNGSTPSGLV